MKVDFDLVIGYSDHSLGVAAASTAVAMGAHIIEKHVKSERSDSSPDAVFSSTLEEMSELVVALRQIETMQGKPRYGPTDAEIPMLNFRRSVIVGRDIEIGEIISEGDLVVKRPAIGAEPRYLSDFLGRKAARKLVRGEGIQITDVEN
jgi:sialic acid synthase SpsE